MEIEKRVQKLEEELDTFKRRMEPGLKLYETLIPFGIDRYMLPLLRTFAKEYEAAQNGKERTSIWNLKWARWAAIIGIVFILVQVIMFGLVIYNTAFGVHTGP